MRVPLLLPVLTLVVYQEVEGRVHWTRPPVHGMTGKQHAHMRAKAREIKARIKDIESIVAQMKESVREIEMALLGKLKPTHTLLDSVARNSQSKRPINKFHPTRKGKGKGKAKKKGRGKKKGRKGKKKKMPTSFPLFDPSGKGVLRAKNAFERSMLRKLARMKALKEKYLKQHSSQRKRLFKHKRPMFAGAAAFRRIKGGILRGRMHPKHKHKPKPQIKPNRGRMADDFGPFESGISLPPTEKPKDNSVIERRLKASRWRTAQLIRRAKLLRAMRRRKLGRRKLRKHRGKKKPYWHGKK